MTNNLKAGHSKSNPKRIYFVETREAVICAMNI